MVSSTVPTSPDPATPSDEYAQEVAESSPEMDFPYHVRTFNRVLATAKWFVVHLLILLLALYFGPIKGNTWAAAALIGISIVLLIYGVLRRSDIRQDVAEGLKAGPRAPEANVRDKREIHA